MASMCWRGCLGRCLATAQDQSSLWSFPAKDPWTQRSQHDALSPDL